MQDKTASFRFYEELNDFLPIARKKIQFLYTFKGNPSVKDTIEAIGVPHTEIDLILVNDASVDFSYLVQDGDQIAVYPTFEAIDISPLTKLRPKPLRNTKFILDVHLGKLAKYLRLLGFDTLFETGYEDDEIVKIAKQQHRIILTRDKGLLKNNSVTHGYWVRNTNPKSQVKEIITRFDLISKALPFSRCLECNGELEKIAKENIVGLLPQKTNQFFHDFAHCTACKKVYWEGSHYKKMKIFVDDILLQ